MEDDQQQNNAEDLLHQLTDDDQEEDEDENQRFFHFMRALLLSERRLEHSTNPQLVEQLPIQTLSIRNAFLTLPRGDFVPADLSHQAYTDSALRLAKMGFNISAPHMYAICLEALGIQPGHYVLDIGCGCGHFTGIAALLTEGKGLTLGLDLRQDIIDFAQGNLIASCEKNNVEIPNVEFCVRNCFLPDPDDRKYDRIHCGASCPVGLLDKLIDLLATGGILVTPCGEELLKITKIPVTSPPSSPSSSSSPPPSFSSVDDTSSSSPLSLSSSTPDVIKQDYCIQKEVISNVRYGELCVPSSAEIQKARFQTERKKARIVSVPKSSFTPSFLASFQSLNISGSDLSNLLDSAEGSDCFFMIDDVKIPAHSAVLSQRCDHFKALFNSGMRECNQGTETQLSVHNSISLPIFRHLLRYIYSDKVEITWDNVVELLDAGDFYQMERLKCMCEHWLTGKMEEENVCGLLTLADTHYAHQLKRVCTNFIIDHFREVSKTCEFPDLPNHLLVEVTREACDQLARAYKQI